MCRYWIRQTCAFLAIILVAFLETAPSAPQTSAAKDLRQLGRTALAEGRHSVADRQLRLALAEFEKEGNAVEIAATLGDLASVLIMETRYSQAELLLDRALSLMPAGSAHVRETSRLLGNLGALYVHTERDAAAESTFKRAARLLEKDGRGDPHIIVLLGNLGSVYVKNG